MAARLLLTTLLLMNATIVTGITLAIVTTKFPILAKVLVAAACGLFVFSVSLAEWDLLR